jgi:hypothetical protein
MKDFRSDAGMTDFPGLEQGTQITVCRLFGHPCGDRHGEAVPPLQGRPAANLADEVDEVVHELRLDGGPHEYVALRMRGAPARDCPARDCPIRGRDDGSPGEGPCPPQDPFRLRLRLSRAALHVEASVKAATD